MDQIHSRNVLFISLSQFGIAFSFNFIMVFVPFYIHKISPYSSQQTLIWIGLIMAASSLMAAVASPFWGAFTRRYHPKSLFMTGLLSHAILIFLMGFINNLPLLFAVRLIQGILGGISTIGFIMVSSTSLPRTAAADLGFFQNSLTLGQLIGPPLGALAAATLGYKGAFISASIFVFITLIFCFLYIEDVPLKRKETGKSVKNVFDRKLLIAWTLCFTGTVQLMFLPSILPNVFDYMSIEHSVALKWSGIFIMSYTATALIGTYYLCKISVRMESVKLIILVAGLGALMQGLFALCPEIWSFVTVRLVQTALMAAVLPLTIALFASNPDGKVIGFLNASRFAGNAMGPIIATGILAVSNLHWVYLAISGLSLITAANFYLSFKGIDK